MKTTVTLTLDGDVKGKAMKIMKMRGAKFSTLVNDFLISYVEKYQDAKKRGANE